MKDSTGCPRYCLCDLISFPRSLSQMKSNSRLQVHRSRAEHRNFRRQVCHSLVDSIQGQNPQIYAGTAQFSYRHNSFLECFSSFSFYLWKLWTAELMGRPEHQDHLLLIRYCKCQLRPHHSTSLQLGYHRAFEACLPHHDAEYSQI